MIITPSCCHHCTATGANNDRDTSQFMVTRQIVFKVCLSVCVYCKGVSVCCKLYVCRAQTFFNYHINVKQISGQIFTLVISTGLHMCVCVCP